MNVEFNDIKAFHPGLINDLLSRSYANITGTIDKDRENFKQFDKDVFEHPQWLGKYVFITTLDNVPVGFVSFDPRKKPLAEIGHNCIVPEYRGSGLGKKQILYALSQIRDQGFETVAVSTCEHEDFIPAQKMYLSSGFKEVYRFENEEHGDTCKKMIQYELKLKDSSDHEK